MPLLELIDLEKDFVAPDGARTRVLRIRSLALDEGEQVALEGASGSGKTTLLHLIAGVLLPDRGRVLLGGEEVSGLPEPARDRFRARNIGYVFQSFHLLPGCTALENVLLAGALAGRADGDRARALLERVGLQDRLHHRPRELSLGQQQRVAVARALVNRPRLVLADEPTGNLDRARADEALALLRDACRESGAALFLVSHDPAVIGAFPRVERLP